MADQPIDAKPQADSSPANTDVNPQAAAPSPAATPTSDPAYMSGLQDVIKGVLAQNPPPPQEAEDRNIPTEEEGKPQGETKAPTEEPSTEDEPTEEAPDTDTTKTEEENKGPIPYERFSEVVEEKNAVTQQLQEMQPVVEDYQRIKGFLEDQRLTAEDFHWALNLVAAKRNNPDAYLKMLQPDIDQLGQMKEGGTLDDDLKLAVENAEISAEWAKKVQATRAKEGFMTRNAQAQQEAQQREQMRAFQHSMTLATTDWAKATAKADPDFQPSKKGEIGLHETFCALLQTTATQNTPKNPQEMKALCEAVYKKVKPLFTSKPKTNGVHVRTNQQTAPSSKGEPKSFNDVIRMGVAKYNQSVTAGRR